MSDILKMFGFRICRLKGSGFKVCSGWLQGVQFASSHVQIPNTFSFSIRGPVAAAGSVMRSHHQKQHLARQ
jgi:hypothetical protein